MTPAQEKCSKVLRSLRVVWAQDHEVVLNESLKAIGLKSEYLETDLELFNVFSRKAISKFGKKVSPTFRSRGTSSL